MGAVFFCFYFCFNFFFFLFPHKTGGVCKCASAIWTLSGVGFEEKLQASQHGQDPLTGPLYVVVDPETWSTMERRRENQGWALFCGGQSAGLQNPRGNWEGQYEYTWLVHLSSPPPSWALTPCPHQLTYALLFIQAVRYHFGDGSTITTGGLLRLRQSHWKEIPKLK